MEAGRIFDTHTHYNHPDFSGDLQEVLKRIWDAGVRCAAVIGYDLDSSRRAIRLAEDPAAGIRLLAVPGIHPLHVDRAEEEDLAFLEVLLEDPHVKMLGEIGLDYHRKEPNVTPDKELQEYYLRKQIRIARRAGLPIVIHSRDAAQDTARILQEEKAGEVGGIIHCFSYSYEMAEIFMRLGFSIGIGGVVTRPAAKKLREVAERVPLDRLVLETDAPYLAPEGKRGERNDSTALLSVADVIAGLRNISTEELKERTWENACRLFRVTENGCA